MAVTTKLHATQAGPHCLLFCYFAGFIASEGNSSQGTQLQVELLTRDECNKPHHFTSQTETSSLLQKLCSDTQKWPSAECCRLFRIELGRHSTADRGRCTAVPESYEIDYESELGRHSRTEIGRHSATELGKHSRTELGRHSATELGRHSRTELGRHSRTELGRHSRRELGRHFWTELGRHSGTDLGRHCRTKLGRHSGRELGRPS
jgi:hypothetical protein